MLGWSARHEGICGGCAIPNVIIPNGGAGASQPGLVSQYINPAPPSSGIIYISKGERWDSISWRMYGNPFEVAPLIANNPGIAIQDTVDAGVQVFVPLISPTITADTASPFG
jgi:phage tail protein X